MPARDDDALDPRSERTEAPAMCMNCGCGEPEKRHHPTDITSDDLQRAADGGGISLDEAARNLQESIGHLASPMGQGSEAGTTSSAERA